LALIESIELWFAEKRRQVFNENRNIYAYSHAVAHNSVGRATYTELKRCLATEPHNRAKLKELFLKSEKFLKWAIGYHLPSGFADPYIDLSALYIHALEHRELHEFLTENSRSRTEAYLHHAIRLNPNKQKAHYLLGKLYQSQIYQDELLPQTERQGKKSYAHKALAAYERAGEYRFSYFRIAELYQNLGENDKAIIKLKQCMDLYPIYSSHHQQYLQLCEQKLRKQLAALNTKPDATMKHALLKQIKELRELDGDINQTCFTGEVAVFVVADFSPADSIFLKAVRPPYA